MIHWTGFDRSRLINILDLHERLRCRLCKYMANHQVSMIHLRRNVYISTVNIIQTQNILQSKEKYTIYMATRPTTTSSLHLILFFDVSKYLTRHHRHHIVAQFFDGDSAGSCRERVPMSHVLAMVDCSNLLHVQMW